MRLRVVTILAIALLCLAPTISWADLAPYSQDFEGLDQQAGDSLANDGWLIFANVFGPDWGYWYGYGVFTAPNGGPGFSGIDLGQGGPEQGDQQLVIYNDYNNGNHGDGSNAIIEANVFQEQTIGAADIGSTWRFKFDAKKGNIDGATANAFIKTLDPFAGYATTNFITADMTGIPEEWDSYSIDIYIDASLEGQLLQFGFVTWASNYAPSGIFYDNINVDVAPLNVSLDIRPGGCPNPINSKSRGVLSAALLGTEDFDVANVDVDFLTLEGLGPVHASIYDVATPFKGDLCGCNETGPDGFMDLTLQFDTQELLEIIGSHSGYLVLTLTGTLHDGTKIEGQDCVLFVGGGGRHSDAGAERMSTKSRRLPGDDEAPGGAQELDLRP